MGESSNTGIETEKYAVTKAVLHSVYLLPQEHILISEDLDWMMRSSRATSHKAWLDNAKPEE
jgi:hypothetical protein